MPPLSEQAPPHEFPSWPMNCLAFYCHLANDYGRFLQTVGGSVTDPGQIARAEGDLGVTVMHDWMQAWYDLALSPFTAMTKVAAGASEFPAAEPDAAAADAVSAAKIG